MKSAHAATPPTIPRQWAWHYRELLRLREGLLQLRAEWDAALREREAAWADGEHPPMPVEQRQLLDELSSQAAELAEVEAALARIFAGGYGRCEVTGRPISRQRLKSAPWTRVAGERQSLQR